MMNTVRLRRERIGLYALSLVDMVTEANIVEIALS